MAADVGLIKSVSQAYKNNEVDYNVGQGIADFGNKVAAGISKRGDIQREQKVKDDLRREKQDAAQKRSADIMQNNLLETSSHAKTPRQTDMILSKAKEWRSESNEYFKIMAESSSDSPEYMKAQEGLLKIRTAMQNSVSSLDLLNSTMELRRDISKSSGYADFNNINNGDGTFDTSVMDRTAGFLAESYEAKWDDDGFLVISDGKDEEGNNIYSSISDYDAKLARVPDTTVSDKFSGITDELQREGDQGKPLDKGTLQHDFNLYRESLVKPGQDNTDQLLTILNDNPIPGVDLKETNEDLIKRLQSSDDTIRVQAKRDAVDFLFGEKDSEEGFLWKTAERLHKNKLDRYNAIKAQNSKSENKNNANKIDISSMIVRDSFDSGDIILPNKNPNDLNSNKVHSLQKERTVTYNTAAVLTDKNYRVTPVEEEQRGYRKDQFAVSVTDPRGIEVAGPFYSEEDLSGFLELIQSQK
jgi:hypothetical protein